MGLATFYLDWYCTCFFMGLLISGVLIKLRYYKLNA